MTEQEKKLRALIADIISEKEKDTMSELSEKNEEALAKAMESNKELKDMVEKLERESLKKVNVHVPGTDRSKELWFGYDVKAQGLGLLDSVENAPLSLQKKLFIKDDAEREHYAKWLITAIKAMTGDYRAKTAMNEGTGSQGGYLVPDEYEDMVFAFARLNSFALNDCDVINMNHETLYIPAENGKVSVAWKGETTAAGASDPTFDQVELVARKLTAYSTASNELLEDSTDDIVSRLTSQFAEAIGQELDDSVLNAGGASTFTGALSAAGSTVSCAATGTSPNRHAQITFDELSQAIMALPANKINGAKYYLHRYSLHYLRTEEDTAGNPIWQAPAGNQPGMIYTYPYVTTEKISTAPDADSPFILFANMKNYALGRRRGRMTLDVDPYGKFLENQTRFRTVTRWDGSPYDTSGFVAIKTHA